MHELHIATMVRLNWWALSVYIFIKFIHNNQNWWTNKARTGQGMKGNWNANTLPPIEGLSFG